MAAGPGLQELGVNLRPWKTETNPAYQHDMCNAEDPRRTAAGTTSRKMGRHAALVSVHFRPQLHAPEPLSGARTCPLSQPQAA